jgi:copper transport protein
MYRAVLAGLLMLVLLLVAPVTTSAHAALESSTPLAGEVSSSARSEVTLSFTEPLEQSYSRLELYDSQGTLVEGTTLTFGEDGFTMVLALPEALPNDTYSVLWRTLSEADGHTAQNYITFTVGSNSNIVPIVIPGTSSDGDAVPQWLKTASRWAALLGAALLMAAWPVWSTIIRPGLGGVRPHARQLVGRIHRYILVAAILAIAGSVFALLVQASTLTDGSPLDKVINTLGQTRYGKLWLLRVGLLLCLGLVLPACGWWIAKRRQVEGIAAWGLAIGAAIPFSLIAHASAQPSGRTFTIVADAIHLVASAMWFGGIALLVTVLLPGLRPMTPDDRSRVLRIVVPRFSAMSLVAMATIGLTGFYAGWLHVGNLSALTGTSYGRALIVKLVALVVILALAGVNLLIIERRIQQRDTGEVASVWSPRLRWTVTGEFILALILLAAVGQMTSLQPARDVMVEQSRQVAIDFEESDPSTTLLLAPGVAGVNHFRVEVGGPALSPETEVLLRLTIPDRSDLGTREIQLSRVSGNAFEHHGSEIGIAADWELTVVIREPGAAQFTTSATATVGTTAPDVDVPADPWRFDTLGGLTGLVLVLSGVAGVIVGWRSGRGVTRKETTGLGIAALLIGCILLFQARIDPILANAGRSGAIDPANVAMVQRGEDIYVQQCLSCHGAELRGEGPAGEGLVPPPADFSAPHTMVHSIEDLIYWIRNGKQGTGMPAFGDVLSDDDIAAVLSYIEQKQEQFAGDSQAFDPTSCNVQTTTIEQLESFTQSGDVASTSLPAVANASVDNTIFDAITETTNQLLACTNAMDTMRRLSLFSGPYLANEFIAGVPADFAATASTFEPLPEESWLRLVTIRDVQQLEDGRVIATVEVEDPTGQLNPETEGSAVTTAQLVFVRSGDTWLIDAMLPA